MKWVRRLYPALFAMFPILAQVARNPGYFPLRDVLIVQLVVLASVAILYVIAYLILWRRGDRDRAADLAALLAFAWVAAFYLYVPFPLGSIKQWTASHVVATAAIATTVVGALLVIYVRKLYRRAPSVAAVGRFLTLTGTLLVIASLGRIALERVHSYRATRDSAFAHELARPIPVRDAPVPGGQAAGATATQPQRDIYVIILDGYADVDVYRERYGFDNTPFEDSLRALGFRIPTVRSNYANTIMSVTSFLNFEHTHPLADIVGADSRDYAAAAYFMEHNRAEQFLRARGYHFAFFPSAWYTPTDGNSDADREFDPYTDFNVTRAIARSQLATYFSEKTLVTLVMPHLPSFRGIYQRHAALTMQGLTSVPAGPHPTFALAHVLMPHLPYIVDSACRPLPDRDTTRNVAGQLTCVNRETLRTVHQILDRSDPKPIIIIQGDHGSQSLKPFAVVGALPSTEQARERFRAFGAYYLPDGGAAAMPDSVSIVNVLRYVFGYYFNADLPALPTTMYFSHYVIPYRLTEIDANFHVVPSSPLRVDAR